MLNSLFNVPVLLKFSSHVDSNQEHHCSRRDSIHVPTVRRAVQWILVAGWHGKLPAADDRPSAMQAGKVVSSFEVWDARIKTKQHQLIMKIITIIVK